MELKILAESFKKYKLTYSGTNPKYKIHDPNPYVLAIDDNYNVDGKGRSILGINLNYFEGDVKKLVNDINDVDNSQGFRGFDMQARVKRYLARDKQAVALWEIGERKRRYQNLIENFPLLGKFVRRYKISGINSQKRILF